jgi:bifunctional N-acetylglucosamine-1-phosphate-uridyltransferase/glucosamine-1-phosphate-acetyltransferase GlmU-like protein
MPKLLVPVAGRPMIDRLLDLHAPFVDRAAIVVHPSARERVSDHLRHAVLPIGLFVQEAPTGMLDAVLLATAAVERHQPDRVWITWCDQIAVHPATLTRLAEEDAVRPAPALALPTCRCVRPYVHLARDAGGRITRILHRREGDPMPDVGESDAGVFDLSADAFLGMLPEFARDVEPAAGTRERNFVPFVAWVSARAPVVTFPCTEPEEAIGVNTPEDLAAVEAHLRARSRA